jgi:hypothetical protein
MKGDIQTMGPHVLISDIIFERKNGNEFEIFLTKPYSLRMGTIIIMKNLPDCNLRNGREGCFFSYYTALPVCML